MKIINLLAILYIGSTLWSQETIYFESEIDVSDGAQYGNVRPRMALSNGTPVILYGKGGTGALYVSRWNGSGFDAPVDILPAGMETYLAGWTGPDIAAKGDTVIAVFKAMPLETGNVYAVRSTDGGITFSDTIRVDNHDSGVAWMPSLDITADGNPVVTYMVHDASWINPRYVIANSSDAGLTYNPEMEVTGSIPGEACDCCPAEVAISGSKQVMLFRNNESNIRDIYGVLSLDDGLTFPHTENVDNTQWYITSCPSTGPSGTFVGNDLYTTFASRADGDYRVYVTKSDATSDLTFTTRDTVIESNLNTSSQNYPRIHSSGDTIVLAWQENQGSNADIYVSIATGNINDHLINLSEYPTLANETVAGSQINPDIRIAQGVIHLCYQDLSSGNVIYRRGSVSGVGLSNNTLETITVSPNPSVSGVFRIESETTLQKIQITDISGRLVQHHISMENGSMVIRLVQPAIGTYLFRGEAVDGAKVFSKLVVQQ